MWEFPVPDGLVLARPDVSAFFLLNSSARFLWDCLQRGLTPSEAVPVFAAHFGIPETLAARDIDSTLAVWNTGLLAPETARSASVASSDSIGVGSSLKTTDCLVHGRPLRVHLEPGLVWDEIAPRLAPVLSRGSDSPLHTFSVASTADRVYVHQDGRLIGDESNAAAARAILLQAMAFPEEPAAILHAGGCGGILIAGATHSGKTTLCAALMARGLPYHCDDSAVLDRNFRVASMPFSIMLRRGSWPVLEPLLPTLGSIPSCLRWGESVRFLPPAPQPGVSAPVRGLVFVQYRPESRFNTAQLSVLETLIQLQRSGFWVEHSRESIQRFLDWLTVLPRHSLVYTRLEDAVAFIESLNT